MQKRWIIIPLVIAVLHFAATAGFNIVASSQCRPSRLPACDILEPVSSALSFPLLQTAAGFAGGALGWRTAFIVFAANSLLTATLLTGVFWLVASRRSGRRDP